MHEQTIIAPLLEDNKQEHRFCSRLGLSSRHTCDARRSHDAKRGSLFAHGRQRLGHVLLARPRAARRPPPRPAGDGLPGPLLLLLQRQVQGFRQQLIFIVLQASSCSSCHACCLARLRRLLHHGCTVSCTHSLCAPAPHWRHLARAVILSLARRRPPWDEVGRGIK